MFQTQLNDLESGGLRLDLSDAMQAHTITTEWLKVLKDMRRSARSIPKADGFSDLPSAIQLAGKFDRLAGEGVLLARLGGFIEVGEELSDLFLYSIRQFEAQDNTEAKKYLSDRNLS